MYKLRSNGQQKTSQKEHVCHEHYCKTCKDFYSEDHFCYIQPVNNENNSQKEKAKKKGQLQYNFLTSSVPRTIFLNVRWGILQKKMESVNTAQSLGAVASDTILIYVWCIKFVPHAWILQ